MKAMGNRLSRDRLADRHRGFACSGRMITAARSYSGGNVWLVQERTNLAGNSDLTVARGLRAPWKGAFSLRVRWDDTSFSTEIPIW